MQRIIVALIVIAALGAAWYLASPLFIDDTVDEELSFASPAGGVDLSVIMAMPPSRREAIREEIMATAAAAPDRPVAERVPVSAPELIAEGTFVDADAIHKGRGQVLMYRNPDGRHLARFEDFRITNGPALVVYLVKHPAPTRASQVTDGGFVKLGALKGNVGSQNYPVPADIDVSAYGSVVIWCELFGVLFSPASLVPLES